MRCEEFRQSTDLNSVEALEHMRSCEECMNVAIESDSNHLFRALGGQNLQPVGGVDLFVADVLREVQLRDKQQQWTSRHRMPVWSRWSAAAALAVVMLSLVATNRHHTVNQISTPSVAHLSTPLTERPVVESYDNGGATIVEVPIQQNDAKVVMVFDESLPADL